MAISELDPHLVPGRKNSSIVHMWSRTKYSPVLFCKIC